MWRAAVDDGGAGGGGNGRVKAFTRVPGDRNMPVGVAERGVDTRVLEGNSSYAHLLNAIETSGFVCFYLSSFWWSYRQNPGSHTCYVSTPMQIYMSAKCPRD